MTFAAWWNGYEVVAARSEEEAREVVRAMKTYDEKELDGDGWKTLRPDVELKDEDGTPLGETVADVLRGVDKPSPLWSCEV